MLRHPLLLALLLVTAAACRTVRPVADEATPPDLIPAVATPQPPSELRGVWITRFEWADPNPDTLRARVVRAMDDASRAGFNAVFFQVRGMAETLYPSPFETWSKLVGARDPGFDPVAFAVEEARRRGLMFHAYVNLMPLWNEDAAPVDSAHLYFRHGPDVDPDSSWLLFEAGGRPMKRNEYYYLNPALPQVKTHLKRVVRHLVETYDVDGVHFDRIRYPGPDYLSDPVSESLFRADSLRSPLSRADWARTTLNDLVEDVVAEALLVKPYLQISASVWGLYRTDDLPGYEHFNSGYAHYYQDAVVWLDRGIMDFIVPMIYWDLADPKPNLDDLWADLRQRTPNWPSILPGLQVRSGWIDSGETIRQIAHLRETGARGHVLFSLSGIRASKGIDRLHTSAYATAASGPPPLKRLSAERVVALQIDSLEIAPGEPVALGGAPAVHRADGEGWIAAILPERPRMLEFAADTRSVVLPTRDWLLPYRYAVAADGRTARVWPWVEFRRLPSDTTHERSFPVLAKTDWPARSSINRSATKTYRTGIFFDQVDFTKGPNRIRAEAGRDDGSRAVYEREILAEPGPEPRPPFPLWVESRSLEPEVDQELLPDDVIRLAFNGSKGQRGFLLVEETGLRLPLRRDDRFDFSRYQGELSLALLDPGRTYRLRFELAPADTGASDVLEIPVSASVAVGHPWDFPLVRVTEPQSILSYNLGPIRLGGPIIAEYEPGVLLRVDGVVGDYYRVRLDGNDTGFIHRDNVAPAEEGSVAPGYYLQSVSASAEDGVDVVRIPYPEPVPYAVVPEPELGRIRVRLFGVKTSSTWMTHRSGLKVIERVDWEQETPDTYALLVYLESPRIWGYSLEQGASTLTLRVKHPPSWQPTEEAPLAGLKVAIEAGHGGSGVGAEGLSGLAEKDVNLAVALELERICREHGIEVLQIRSDDRDMGLEEKRSMIEESDADLAVAIHANSAGTTRGYLGTAGTSTYYHNPFWAPFAKATYERLLELPLAEFGVVGSFNYRVIRLSSRPAILVEQAFMSHAEDEEKLADPAFQTQMARKIYEGMVSFVAGMPGS